MSYALVQEFNDLFEVKTRTEGGARVREAKLRFRLIDEEFEELLAAIKDVDIVELADALGDIEYVVWGALQVFGMADLAQEKLAVLREKLPQDLQEMELSTNPLLTAEGQKEILDDLRKYILINDIEYVSSTLVTVLYLVTLASVYYSIDIDGVIEAIHKSNMTKLGADGKVIRRPEDNKVLKGPNYKEPTEDIENILFGEELVDTGE